MSKIAELNDVFRTTGNGGKFMVTPGVLALSDEKRARLFAGIMTYWDWNGGNDPHGEHDFGIVLVDKDRCFWKIDYYDAACEYGSEDPSDPAQTTRVLTVMLASEY